jgi:hypothetical protein
MRSLVIRLAIGGIVDTNGLYRLSGIAEFGSSQQIVMHRAWFCPATVPALRRAQPRESINH